MSVRSGGPAGGPGSIHLISASAGSGKTHRLVDELEGALTRTVDPVRPEALIATTFTVKAAAELRERVRSRLLEKGHVGKAQRLGAARIGTVNSVCAQLVTEFAFDLGLSPECRVLDEEAADRAFAHALSGLVSDRREEGATTRTVGSPAAAALIELAERWPGLDWLADVREIAARARENGLAPDRLRACAGRSADGLLACLGPAAKGGAALEGPLGRALDGFLHAPHDETGTTAGVVKLARQARALLGAERPLSWWMWSKLAASEPGKRSREAFEPVREAARGHERHPALRADVRLCIGSVFELAAQALEAYARHKREWGLMDFVDQEVQALALLRSPRVREMLGEQVDLVLVDEFQDTSPLQLEIFLALARIAPRSVWVGDQKQAIYGFRGTDPALMDAALDALEARAGGEGPETLGRSRRSRPGLVVLTSDVFAPAFERHGIPAERVRLEPAREEPGGGDGLGHVVEAWRLGGRVKADQAAALAVAAGELLADPEARILDPRTNDVRRVRPGDIAVLCRSGANCGRVTTALEAAGIPAVRARTGLMDTPEARVTLAALRLWVDPHESLAAAELGRLLVHPGDPDRWLASLLETPGQAYRSAPELVGIVEARARLPLAGPVAAFDAVLEAAGLRETCLRWGRSEQRLANLDALRALAHRYVEECGTEGEAATVAGLVAHLAALAAAAGWKGQKRGDDQAVPSGTDAVTVSTLHGAKGLEWPVTVLYEIDSARRAKAFGVHVADDRAGFDFEEPLAGRWIRYWPDPYAPPGGANYRGDTELHETVRRGPEHAAVERRETREALRLLYVGWTRARDRLVLAAKPGKFIGDTLALLADAQGGPLLTEPAEHCVWAGRDVTARIRQAEPATPGRVAPEPGHGYDAAGAREHPPADVRASEIPGTGTLGEAVRLLPAPFVQLPAVETALGSACHAFLAADRPGLDEEERQDLARRLLEGWSVQGAMRAEDLPRISDALRAWVAERWPDAVWRREWPLRMRLADGSQLTGYADLVLETGEGMVLVDHKCLARPAGEALRHAAGYAGQIHAYATALEKATGRPVLAGFLHLVLQGQMVLLG